MGRLLWWFYQLRIHEAILLLLTCSLIFCGTNKILGRYRWWKLAAICGFGILAVAILYTTLGRQGSGDYQINLVPFHSYRAVRAGANPELYRSNFMNAAMFYPAGLLLTSLLPRKWPGWCRCLLAVLLLGAVSIGIEYIQYRYSLGQVEIDDVIHNVAGALAGSLAVLILSSAIDLVSEKLTVRITKK